MGRRNIAKLFKLETAKSLAASFQTEPFNNSQVDAVGFMIDANSVTDNTGTFTVQWRGFKGDRADDVTPWVDLTLSGTIQLADVPDEILANLNQLPPGQVRLSFVPAGGTPDGTADIWVTAASLGA